MRNIVGTAVGWMLSASLLVASQVSADTLRVAMLDSNPPWEYVDDSGSAQGFEVDIVRAAIDRLGMDASYIVLPFGAMLDQVQAGDVDIAIGSVSVTDERVLRFGFSQPYFRTDVVVLAPVEMALIGDDQLFGSTVGYVAGTSGEDLVQQYADSLGIETVVPYPVATELLDALRSGEVHAMISEFASGLHFVKEEPDYEIALRASAGRDVGLALRPGFEHGQRLNDILSDMKRDGTMVEIYTRWFGDPPTPDTVTLTPLDMPVPN